jgi:hypothetical protein
VTIFWGGKWSEGKSCIACDSIGLQGAMGFFPPIGGTVPGFQVIREDERRTWVQFIQSAGCLTYINIFTCLIHKLHSTCMLCAIRLYQQILYLKYCNRAETKIVEGEDTTVARERTINMFPRQRTWHDMTWLRTRAAAVRGRRLTAWIMALPSASRNRQLILWRNINIKYTWRWIYKAEKYCTKVNWNVTTWQHP